MARNPQLHESSSARGRNAADDAPKQAPEDASVDSCVRQRINGCPYSFYFCKVTWRYDHGTLKLTGMVPSFYMKQILQTILRDMDDVEQIVNDVDVVSSTGLSSVRHNRP